MRLQPSCHTTTNGSTEWVPFASCWAIEGPINWRWRGQARCDGCTERGADESDASVGCSRLVAGQEVRHVVTNGKQLGSPKLGRRGHGGCGARSLLLRSWWGRPQSRRRRRLLSVAMTWPEQ